LIRAGRSSGSIDDAHVIEHNDSRINLHEFPHFIGELRAGLPSAQASQ
jgi:hypothetical protein